MGGGRKLHTKGVKCGVNRKETEGERERAATVSSFPLPPIVKVQQKSFILLFPLYKGPRATGTICSPLRAS